MPTRSYHEALWESVPEGLDPPDFDLRRAYLLKRVQAGDQVLDVGCGEGRFAAELADAGASVVGIDVAEEPLRRARALRPDLELALVEDDGGWPFADASFDLIWAGEVLEHVADTGGWLSELRRVLRAGGGLLLSTPNHDPLAMLAAAVRPTRFAAHFDPVADHLRFYTRLSLGHVLDDFGFEDIVIEKACGPPGARRLLLASAQRRRW